jgi:hypothetical protein
MLAAFMKTAKRSGIVKGHQSGGRFVTGAVLLCALVTASAISSVAPANTADNQPTPAQSAAATTFAPPIAEIAKMVDAKVNQEVILAYIRNSPTAYNPSATEIIALKDQGVSSDILTAMLQHGAEVRAQSIRAVQAAQAAAAPQSVPGAANPYAPAPAYDPSAQPVYPNYVVSYPDYSYAYSAPVYPAYGYSSSWPSCWPYFSFGLGCYPWGGYCGYPYGGCGYHYPYYCGNHGSGYYYGNHGYYSGSYRGHGGYHGDHGYYGSPGYHGYGARPAPYAGQGGGFHSFGNGSRPPSFAGSAGGIRSAGGFGGRTVSFSGHGGGFGGHSMGRSH